VGPRNTWVVQNNAGNQDLVDLTSAETQNSYGVGIAYDVISGDGVDFSRENWGLQMSCGLDTNRPHAAYVFVHAKQTLVFNQTGLQVIN
jgi:GTPase SAR1 family protein